MVSSIHSADCRHRQGESPQHPLDTVCQRQWWSPGAHGSNRRGCGGSGLDHRHGRCSCTRGHSSGAGAIQCIRGSRVPLLSNACVYAQGNVDPVVLFSTKDAITAAVNDVLAKAGPRGHILNLGHGVLVGTPEENVAHMFELSKQAFYKQATPVAI